MTSEALLQVAKLREELEVKLRVISLPIDICVRHAVSGESSLQAVLDIVIKILQDIESFDQVSSRCLQCLESSGSC